MPSGTPPITASPCWWPAQRSPPGCPPTPRCIARTAAHRQTRPPPAQRRPAGTPAQIAATAQWHTTTVSRYGEQVGVQAALLDGIWHGAFGNQLGRIVLVRDPGEEKILALFTTDRDSTVETIVARYAHRWTIETAIAAGKQLLGIGQARNRLQRAVERTVPFGFVVLQPRHRLVRPARPPPRRPPRPPPRTALVPAQGPARVRRHARQTPQNPCRSTNYRSCRSSTRPRQIPRLRTGLRRSRCVTAKVKSSESSSNSPLRSKTAHLPRVTRL